MFHGIQARVFLLLGTLHYLYAQETNSNYSKDKLFQRDIKLKDNDIARLKGLPAAAIATDIQIWNASRIPYAFHPNLKNNAKRAIRRAIAEYHKRTCIRFRMKKPSDKDYLFFEAKEGCWSYVGKNGGKQEISIGDGCEDKSTAVHEILHALGFWHEQSRSDRDKYIKIVWDNIEKANRYNFEIEKTRNEKHDYDYQSVMHYEKNAFSKNGKPTIISLDPKFKGTNFGQPAEGGLSTTDTQQLNKFYCNVETTNKPITITRTPATTTAAITIETTSEMTTEEPNEGSATDGYDDSDEYDDDDDDGYYDDKDDYYHKRTK